MTKAMPFLQKVILLSYDPRPFGEGFLLCCVCIFRREKITSGEFPFASIKIAVNLG